MKPALRSSQLVVKKSPIHGYGVFAAQNIAPGTLIEECHVLSVGQGQQELWDYYFKSDDQRILVLGNGSIYNHSNRPNACHTFDKTHHLMVFRANTRILAGEEICISYGKSWFDAREVTIKTPPFLARAWQKIKPYRVLFRFMLVTSFVWLVLRLLHV